MAKNDPTKRLLTLDEASDYLALSTRTVRRKIESGELVAHRFGRQWRISPEDLRTFVQTNRRI